MKKLSIMGLDPSMSNFGIVKGLLDLESGELSDLKLILIESPPDSKAKNVRQNSLDLKRANVLYTNLHSTLKGVDMICVEIPVGSQSARAMASYGVCIGILASISQPMIQVTPTEVKLAATNTKTASKAEMIKWATESYPDAGWLTVRRKGALEFVSKNEHLADALAAIHAGVKTDQFKVFHQYLKSSE